MSFILCALFNKILGKCIKSLNSMPIKIFIESQIILLIFILKHDLVEAHDTHLIKHRK